MPSTFSPATIAGRYRLRTPNCRSRRMAPATPSPRCSWRMYLRSGSAAEAMARAASSIFGILKRTAAAGAPEMLLIEAQDELVDPAAAFQPEPV